MEMSFGHCMINDVESHRIGHQTDISKFDPIRSHNVDTAAANSPIVLDFDCRRRYVQPPPRY